MSDQTPALAVEGVSHAYGERLALDGVTFSVPPATFAALLGLNGAGKSTLFSVVTHLYAPRSGSARIFGHDVAMDGGAALSALGVVFQQRTLDPDLSVEQNMLYHGALHGIPRAETRARSRELLQRVGLSDRLGDKARHLSGGQSRRVEIARALIHHPRMLLLDEPTAGLDIKARADILALVRRLVAEDRIGVLWATHLVDELTDEDQVVLLHQGRVLADARSREIVAQTGAASIGAAFSALTRDRVEAAA